MEHLKRHSVHACARPALARAQERTRRLVLCALMVVVALPASARAATASGNFRCDSPWLAAVTASPRVTAPFAPGTFLLFLQNDSDGEVRLNFELPFGWIGPTPAYPITARNRQMLADERRYDELLESANLIACRNKAPAWTGKKIGNVALPTSCDNDTSVHMRVAATSSTYYLRWCNDEVVMKPGSAKYKPKDHAGIKFFAIYVDKSGTPTLKKVQ